MFGCSNLKTKEINKRGLKLGQGAGIFFLKITGFCMIGTSDMRELVNR